MPQHLVLLCLPSARVNVQPCSEPARSAVAEDSPGRADYSCSEVELEGREEEEGGWTWIGLLGQKEEEKYSRTQRDGRNGRAGERKGRQKNLQTNTQSDGRTGP